MEARRYRNVVTRLAAATLFLIALSAPAFAQQAPPALSYEEAMRIAYNLGIAAGINMSKTEITQLRSEIAQLKDPKKAEPQK